MGVADVRNAFGAFGDCYIAVAGVIGEIGGSDASGVAMAVVRWVGDICIVAGNQSVGVVITVRGRCSVNRLASAV